MKVLFDEDLVNHVSPESCGDVGNHIAFGLALLTGENAGGLLSSEITSFSGEHPDLVHRKGRPHAKQRYMRVAERPGGVKELGMYGSLMRVNREK